MLYGFVTHMLKGNSMHSLVQLAASTPRVFHRRTEHIQDELLVPVLLSIFIHVIIESKCRMIAALLYSLQLDSLSLATCSYFCLFILSLQIHLPWRMIHFSIYDRSTRHLIDRLPHFTQHVGLNQGILHHILCNIAILTEHVGASGLPLQRW